MLNNKEYFNQLDADLAVEKLDNETAAAIQGGASLELYDTSNFKRLLGSFNKGGTSQLPKSANDKTSSIIVNEGRWALYKDAGFKGSPRIIYGKGKYVLSGDFNNNLSSLRRVG